MKPFLAALPFLAVTFAGIQTPAQDFEVASIKPVTDCAGRGRGMIGTPTPGRLNMDCVTAENLITMGYVTFAHDKPEMRRVKIEGGPAWVRSEFFAVNAKAEGAAGLTKMYGPMLRALLADRFQLQLHTEDRESPVYFLSVAKGGLKMDPAPEGSCTVLDLDHLPPPPERGQPATKFCGNQSLQMNQRVVHLKGAALTPRELANGMLTNILDRPVIDKTGLDGRYDFDLQFAPDSTTPMFQASGRGGAGDAGPVTAPVDPDGPSIFSAFQKIGLKIEPGKGPVEVIVIDRIERLKEN